MNTDLYSTPFITSWPTQFSLEECLKEDKNSKSNRSAQTAVKNDSEIIEMVKSLYLLLLAKPS